MSDRRLTVNDLLNPSPSTICMLNVTSGFAVPTISSSPIPELQSYISRPTSIQYNIYLNCKTTLSQLLKYPCGVSVEYAEGEGDDQDVVGHLFAMNPRQLGSWSSPLNDFAYSRGAPKEKSKAGEEVFILFLLDLQTGEPVPCIKCHSTCLFAFRVGLDYLGLTSPISRPGSQNMSIC